MEFTSEQLLQILEAGIDDAGGMRAWARKHKVSPSSVGDAIYTVGNFPPIVAKAMGFVKVKDPKRWRKRVTK